MQFLRHRLVLVAASLTIAVSTCLGANRYELVDLNVPGASYSAVSGINESGQVIGTFGGVTSSQAYVYADGAFTYIAADKLVITGRAINGAGQIVGDSYAASATWPNGYIYGNGIFTNIPTRGGIYGDAIAINDSGVVVGAAGNGHDNIHAIEYKSGQLIDLGTLGGGESAARGINEAGAITGNAQVSGNFNHAFLYYSGKMHDLGTLGGDSSVGTAINEAGAVAGASYTSYSKMGHAFIYEDGSMHDIGVLGDGSGGSYALALNNKGVAVGWSIKTLRGTDHVAFVFVDNEMLDLNSLIDPSLSETWQITDAVGINDDGYIVANALHDGVLRSVLLAPVPEPQSSSLLAVGLVAAGTIQALGKRRKLIRGSLQ